LPVGCKQQAKTNYNDCAAIFKTWAYGTVALATVAGSVIGYTLGALFGALGGSAAANMLLGWANTCSNAAYQAGIIGKNNSGMNTRLKCTETLTSGLDMFITVKKC